MKAKTIQFEKFVRVSGYDLRNDPSTTSFVVDQEFMDAVFSRIASFENIKAGLVMQINDSKNINELNENTSQTLYMLNMAVAYNECISKSREQEPVPQARPQE